jgi:hypothetical protein
MRGRLKIENDLDRPTRTSLRPSCRYEVHFPIANMLASDGQFPAPFAPHTFRFQPSFVGGGRVCFNGWSRSGDRYQYFVAQPVEWNSFCAIACREQVEKQGFRLGTGSISGWLWGIDGA